MAIAALNTAATGLRALSDRIDVIANNLANAETHAFKRSRTNFEDLLYTTIRNPGIQNAAGDVTPAGIQIGHGVRVSNTQLDFEQGPMENTGMLLKRKKSHIALIKLARKPAVTGFRVASDRKKANPKENKNRATSA